MSKCLALDWHRAGHSARMPQRLGDGFCSQGAAVLGRGCLNVKQPTEELTQGTVMTSPKGRVDERKGRALLVCPLLPPFLHHFFELTMMA